MSKFLSAYEHLDDWPVAKMLDVTLKIGSGATPTGGESNYLPSREKYALVRSQNVLDRHFSTDGLAFISGYQAERLRGVEIQNNDILLNITGDGVTFARSCRAPADVLPACVNQHVAIVRANQNLLIPGYLLAFLSHPKVKQYIELHNSGGSRRAVTKAHIESFQIPLPRLSVQQAIAEVLDSLDDKIELNRRMNQTLEELGYGLFKSWFVDFDPVQAKLDGRQPVGVPEAARELFPSHFEDSVLGPIPSGWRVGRVGEEFSVTMGQSPPGSTYNLDGNGPPFYQGRTDFGVRFPSRRVYCTAPTRMAVEGETLVSVRAPVGDINRASEACAIGRGLAAVRHKANAPSFTFYQMRALGGDFAIFEGEGTLFGAIGGAAFRELRVVVPPSAVLRSFEDTAGLLDAKIMTNEQENTSISRLRDTLLPALLSGEVSIRNAEKAIAEVI